MASIGMPASAPSDQDLDIQLAKLKAEGRTVICAKKCQAAAAKVTPNWN